MAQDTHLQAWKCLIRSTTALPAAGYYEYSYGMAGDVTTMCLASALIACWDETLVGWLDLDFDASITDFFGIRVGRLVTHTLYDNDLCHVNRLRLGRSVKLNPHLTSRLGLARRNAGTPGCLLC
jgi:hypothetical protein